MEETGKNDGGMMMIRRLRGHIHNIENIIRLIHTRHILELKKKNMKEAKKM